MTGTTQEVINICRRFIPDRKTKTEQVVEEELGFTSAKPNTRESFYVRHTALASPILFVEPHTFVAVATLTSVAATTHVFLWDNHDLKCTFGNGTNGYDPAINKMVKAIYEYSKAIKYLFTDNDLISLIPDAVEWVNRAYDMSYAAGTTPDYDITGVGSAKDKFIVGMSLALRAQNIMIEDLMRGGIGVNFRGSMQGLDNRDQLKTYRDNRDILAKKLDSVLENEKFDAIGDGYSVDIYDDSEVDA